MKNETQQPKHSPEPWTIEGKLVDSVNGIYIVTPKGFPNVVCRIHAYEFWKLTPEIAQANAERIVACVNALKGKPNPELWVKEADEMLGKVVSFEHPELKLGDSKLDKIIELAKQRDELFRALEGIVQSTTVEFAEKWGFGQQRNLVSEVYDRVKWGVSNEGGGHE